MPRRPLWRYFTDGPLVQALSIAAGASAVRFGETANAYEPPCSPLPHATSVSAACARLLWTSGGSAAPSGTAGAGKAPVPGPSASSGSSARAYSALLRSTSSRWDAGTTALSKRPSLVGSVTVAFSSDCQRRSVNAPSPSSFLSVSDLAELVAAGARHGPGDEHTRGEGVGDGPPLGQRREQSVLRRQVGGHDAHVLDPGVHPCGVALDDLLRAARQSREHRVVVLLRVRQGPGLHIGRHTARADQLGKGAAAEAADRVGKEQPLLARRVAGAEPHVEGGFAVSRTAQFEHTLLITDDGAEVLTKA